MPLQLTSTAFNHSGNIPSKYTCDGEEISPPLAWKGAPAETKSFALISDDPDAPVGTWVHWVVWNIPADKTGFEEGVRRVAKLSDGTRQGIDDSKEIGYGSPCPPSGTHRYFFKLYALDALLEGLPERATKAMLEKAMAGHILEKAELMGNYSRKNRL